MAETIGSDSGVINLATSTFQSIVALSQTIQSCKAHGTPVRKLQEELEALGGGLDLLNNTLDCAAGLDLSALYLPLLRCGHACKQFEEELLKYISRSGGRRTSFRNWGKLKYMGDDIHGFTQLLANYKATINIALINANLRKSDVTADSLEVYKNLVTTAIDDLEYRLQAIDENLENMLANAVPSSGSDTRELQLIQEERMSMEKCLEICAQFFEHISQIRLPSKQSDSDNSSEHDAPENVPDRLAFEGIQHCKDDLSNATTELEMHMQDIFDQFVSKSTSVSDLEANLAILARLREEWNTTRRSRNILSKAENHLRENLSVINNYSNGDSVQFMVSTEGKTLNGSNRGLGCRTRQFGGYIDKTTLKKISEDYASPVSANPKSKDLSSQGEVSSDSGNEEDARVRAEYKGFGPGYSLRRMNIAGKSDQFKYSVGGKFSSPSK